MKRYNLKPNRELLLNVLSKQKKPMSASKIYDKVCSIKHSGRTTMHAMLSAMVVSGLVERFPKVRCECCGLMANLYQLKKINSKSPR